MTEIYFDNSATTVCSEQVKNAVVDAMMEDYGNPSAAHLMGVKAEQLVKASRETIAKTLHCQEKELFFTSGGTESDNWALLGGAAANERRGRHLITTGIEHAAILRPMQYLEEHGYEVTYLKPDRSGQIDPEKLKEALRSDTVLVSMMMVNNEMGARLDIEEASRVVKAFDPQILFHVDAVQGYGKYALNLRSVPVDLLSVSGHKLHGPKGSGFLYVRERTKLNPLILGGGQQNGMRSGTDNVPGIVGLSQAAKECYDHLDEQVRHLEELKGQLIAGLAQLENVVIHSGQGEQWAPHIVSASFVGVRSEVLLHALEDRGIYVSAGSACSTNRKLPVSPVMQQLGLPREQLESVLRFSFGRYNTSEEVEVCLRALREYLPVLRRYTRK